MLAVVACAMRARSGAHRESIISRRCASVPALHIQYASSSFSSPGPIAAGGLLFSEQLRSCLNTKPLTLMRNAAIIGRIRYRIDCTCFAKRPQPQNTTLADAAGHSLPGITRPTYMERRTQFNSQPNDLALAHADQRRLHPNLARLSSPSGSVR